MKEKKSRGKGWRREECSVLASKRTKLECRCLSWQQLSLRDFRGTAALACVACLSKAWACGDNPHAFTDHAHQHWLHLPCHACRLLSWRVQLSSVTGRCHHAWSGDSQAYRPDLLCTSLMIYCQWTLIPALLLRSRAGNLLQQVWSSRAWEERQQSGQAEAQASVGSASQGACCTHGILAAGCAMQALRVSRIACNVDLIGTPCIEGSSALSGKH